MDILTLAAANGYTKKRLENIQSAYDLWLQSGNVGTTDDFLESLAPTVFFEINTNGELEVTLNGNS